MFQEIASCKNYPSPHALGDTGRRALFTWDEAGIVFPNSHSVSQTVFWTHFSTDQPGQRYVLIWLHHILIERLCFFQTPQHGLTQSMEHSATSPRQHSRVLTVLREKYAVLSCLQSHLLIALLPTWFFPACLFLPTCGATFSPHLSNACRSYCRSILCTEVLRVRHRPPRPTSVLNWDLQPV